MSGFQNVYELKAVADLSTGSSSKMQGSGMQPPIADKVLVFKSNEISQYFSTKSSYLDIRTTGIVDYSWLVAIQRSIQGCDYWVAYVTMDQPIIMLCCSVHKFHLLCSILCSCERFVLRNKVLLTGIKTFAIELDCFIRVYRYFNSQTNVVTVLLEYIDLLAN